MTLQIDRDVFRTVIRINAGWMIWAASVITSHLVVLAACDTHSMARMGGVRTLLIAVGVIAAATSMGYLFRIALTARKHWATDVSRSDHGVDYLAGTVAVLSLIGIIWTTMAALSWSPCSH